MTSYPTRPTANGRLAVLAPHFPPAFLGGGPIRTLDAMVRRASAPANVFVLTSNRDLGATQPLQVPSDRWTRYCGAHVLYASDAQPLAYLRALLAVRRSRPDTIYLNSLFNSRYSVVPLLLSRLRFWRGATMVLAPRGEMSAGALALKGAKKRAYLSVTRVLGLYSAVTWHASTPLEAREIRDFAGPGAHVLIHEDETDLPASALAVPFRSENLNEAAGSAPARLVFVSRISPKKGLHVLLRALGQVTGTVALDIYGEAEDAGYLSECRALASHVGKHVSVSWKGAIRAEDVRTAFSQYDAFFFPTAGENFGHVVAEALSASCPVALCDVTPWTDAAAQTCGVMEDHEPATWARAIEALAGSSPTERQARREAAGRYYEAWAAERATHPSFLDIIAGEPLGRLGADA